MKDEIPLTDISRVSHSTFDVFACLETEWQLWARLQFDFVWLLHTLNNRKQLCDRLRDLLRVHVPIQRLSDLKLLTC